MKKSSLIIVLGLLVILGVSLIAFGPSFSNMTSSVFGTTSFSTMTEAQLRAYIAEQDALLATANTNLALYQSNKKAAEEALAKITNPQVCANGKTNFPACDNNTCQAGYRLENDVCIFDSECAVVYVYKKISEETTTPTTPTPVQSAAVNSNTSTTPTVSNLDATPTTKIEDTVDIDFTFTNPELELQFLSIADNVKITYDRASSMVKGQFDLSGKTYMCKPLQLKEETDTFAGIACNAEKGDILTCQSDVLYNMSYECNDKSYSYILKKCSTAPNPPLPPAPPTTPTLTLTGSVTDSVIQVNQPVTWTVTPTGGNGTYTYVWSGSDGLTGTGSSVTKAYTTAGEKEATVVVTSGTQIQTFRLVKSVISIPTILTLQSSISPLGKPNVAQPVTLSVAPTGGNGTYTYVWSGSDGLTGTGSSVTKAYTTAGVKTASVRVTSGGQTKIATFSFTVQNPLVVSWEPLAGLPQTNKAVTFTIKVTGGTAPYTYAWSGTDALSSTSNSVTKTYTTAGKKSVTVTVTSKDGQARAITQDINVILPPLPKPPTVKLSATCAPNILASRIGGRVTWNAFPKGGTGTYTYSWIFSADYVGDLQTKFTTSQPIKTYTRAGTKTATLTVNSGNESITTSCVVYVR